MKEQINKSSSDLSNKRKAERRKRQREKRKLEKQCNVTSDGLNPLTAELPKPKKVLTYEDLDPDQKKVYHGIAEWWENQQRVGGVAEPLVVAGFSGSGKTTTLSVSLPALENPDGSKPKIAYAAYTGKAADVMRTKGMDASTIHYLIYNWFQTPQGLISQLKDRDELSWLSRIIVKLIKNNWSFHDLQEVPLGFDRFCASFFNSVQLGLLSLFK